MCVFLIYSEVAPPSPHPARVLPERQLLGRVSYPPRTTVRAFRPIPIPKTKSYVRSRQRIEYPGKVNLREEAELAAVLLGGAYEVLANLAVRADRLAEVGDDLRHGGDTNQRGSSISVRPRRVRRGWTGARVGHAPPRVQGRGDLKRDS